MALALGQTSLKDGQTSLRFGQTSISPLAKGGAPAWNPLQLGSKLRAWWDARTGTTLSGSQITAWADRKNGYTLMQGVSASRPVLNLTGFGGYPCVQTDGVDDFLSMGSQPLPSGSTACRIYGVLQNDDPIGVGSVKVPFFYGGDQTTGRRLTRTVVDGIVALTGSVGTGSANIGVLRPLVNCETGRHRTRLDIASSPSPTVAQTDGIAGTAGFIVPGTASSGSVVIGAMPGGTSPFKGLISDIFITDGTETADELAKIAAFQLMRAA